MQQVRMDLEGYTEQSIEKIFSNKETMIFVRKRGSIHHLHHYRFRAITSSYYRGALGAMLVYDITRRATFVNVRKWLHEVRESKNEDMLVILVGNKSDLGQSREVEKEEGQVFAETKGLCFMETSALQNLNVEEAFFQMITNIHNIISQKTLEAKMNGTTLSLASGKEFHIADDEVSATKHANCCSK